MTASRVQQPQTGSFFKEFRGPSIKIRKPMPRESSRRKIERQIYTQKRRIYLDSHPICEKPNCPRPAKHIHHKALRGMNYLDESTFMAVCYHCHQWIHGNPNEAREAGLLV